LSIAVGAASTLVACGNAITYVTNDGCVAASCSGTNAQPDPPSYSLRRLRRLSSREYDNVVRDLLGDTSRPSTHFLKDSYTNGYDNGSAGLAVQSDQVVAYQAAAEALAATAVNSNLKRLLGDCDVVTDGESACADVFLNTFGARAYRRPLTETELERLRGVFATGAAVGGFATGVQTALELMLQSPQFLYREELGPLDASPDDDAVRLTDFEVASELSFLLTGSIPDDDLWTAVAEGRFTTTVDYRREAERLLSTQGARDTLRAFLHAWFATNRLSDLSKDAKFYPSFNAALAASMTVELDQFFDAILWGGGQGSLRELFTSNLSFVDGALAELYGVPTTGTGFQPVTLDPALRKGILSRAGYLTAHAAADSSGPVSRGVFLLQAILCSPLPPPPANIPAPIPAGDTIAKNLTTRERFAEHVSNGFCASCHLFIDGIGFGFEQFDGIGAFRTMENGKPIDSSGSILGTGEIDGPYDGVAQLATRLAGSQHLADCYAKQAYRFAMGDIEQGGSGSTEWVKEGFSNESRLTDILMTIVKSPVFVTRRRER